MHSIVAVCLKRSNVFACFLFLDCDESGSRIIRACQCTTVRCFVSVMDLRKMKGRMEAGNLAACCLVKEMNLGCHGSRPQGTGVHMRCWGVNMVNRSSGKAVLFL